MNLRAKAEVLSEFRSSKRFIVCTLCLAFFTDDFIYGLIVPVIPFSLPLRSGIPQTEVQFWTSAMLAAFGFANLVASPFLGWLADRSPSRKGFLLLGLLMLGAATVTFGVVSNIYALVASRLFQGLSAAIIYTGGLALLVDTVGHDEIGKWMGLVLSFANAGILVGPLLGGVIYDTLGYNAVFAVMLGIVALDILLRLLMVEKDSAVTYEPNESGSGNPRLVSYQSTGPGHGIREEDPLLTMSSKGAHQIKTPTMLILLTKPRILGAVWGVLVAQTLITSFDGVLAIFVHKTFGWNSSRAGLLFLTVTIPTVAAPLAGMLSDRYGSRWVATWGFALAAAMFALLPLVTHDDKAQVVLLCIILSVLGLAFTAMITPLAADLASFVEQITEEHPELSGRAGAYGRVFSLLNCGVSTGVLCGPLLAGGLYETFGWRTMGWVLSVISGSATIPIIIFTGNKRNGETDNSGVTQA